MKIKPGDVEDAGDGGVLVGRHTIMKVQASGPDSPWGSSVLLSVTIGLWPDAMADVGYRVRLTRGEARDLAGFLLAGADKSEGTG